MTPRKPDWLIRTRFYRTLRLIRDLLRGGDARETAVLTLSAPRGLFQPSGMTEPNRYPNIFAHAMAYLKNRTDLRLLSFGCSTGEEVFTLSAMFPMASIHGIDISPNRIRICRARWEHAGHPAQLSFHRAESTDQEATGSYDAVFAMAVFRHGALGNAPPVCRPYFDPAAAERALTDLARVLKPGGLLAIRHANLHFADLALAADFEPVYLCSPPMAGVILTPIYGLDGRLKPGVNGDCGLYRKKV